MTAAATTRTLAPGWSVGHRYGSSEQIVLMVERCGRGRIGAGTSPGRIRIILGMWHGFRRFERRYHGGPGDRRLPAPRSRMQQRAPPWLAAAVPYRHRPRRMGEAGLRS